MFDNFGIFNGLRNYVENPSNTEIQQITKTNLMADNFTLPIILRWKAMANA
jgi:ligand-binding SRPBCC domain-containing protein